MLVRVNVEFDLRANAFSVQALNISNFSSL